MADFSHVSPGSSRADSPAVSAGWLNAVSDAANYYHSQVAGGDSRTPQRSLPVSGTIVKIKNSTGVDLLRGHVVQLGDYELTDFDFRKLWFDADLVADPLDLRIGLVRQAIKSGDYGPCQMLGVSTALVDVDQTSHTHAKAEDGEKVLASSTSGPLTILSPITTTGEQEVAVLLGGGGARAELVGALAIIKGTVPASSAIDTSSPTSGTGAARVGASVVTEGRLTKSATDTAFTSGALLVNLDGTAIVEDDPTFTGSGTPDKVLAVRDVLNPGYTSFIGEGPGIFIAGALAIQDDDEAFVLPTFELRSQPGFVLGSDTEDDAQALYHEGGDRDQKVGRDEC